MIEKILIAVMSFVLGCVFLRLWEAWNTRRRLDKCLKEIVEKKLRISLKDYSSLNP